MNANDTILREAQISDCAQVKKLQRELGIDPDSEENWQRIWVDNPYMENDTPIGWILENEKEVVGYIGNVPLRYDIAGESVHTVAARGWVVKPEFRKESLRLVMPYLKQKNTDVILNSSSNDVAFRIFSGLGAQRVPHDVWGKIYFWIIREQRFFTSVFRKIGFSKNISGVVGRIVNLLLTVKLRLDKLKLLRQDLKIDDKYEFKVFRPHELGREFDELWHQKVTERRRFFARRDSIGLRWHFGCKEAQIQVIACFLAGSLRGYIALAKKDQHCFEFIRCQVIDLFVLEDNEDIIKCLLLKAYRLMQGANVDVLEIIGFPKEIRRVVCSLKPWDRKTFPNPFTFKVVNPCFNKAEFSEEKFWYPSLFDGDSSL